MTHDSYINIYNNQLRSKSKLSTQFLSKNLISYPETLTSLLASLRHLRYLLINLDIDLILLITNHDWIT